MSAGIQAAATSGHGEGHPPSPATTRRRLPRRTDVGPTSGLSSHELHLARYHDVPLEMIAGAEARDLAREHTAQHRAGVTHAVWLPD